MIKRWLKEYLRYHPLRETMFVREIIEEMRESDLPYCPSWEGDLIWSLITLNHYSRCLETGFGTGSTALYMLDAVGDHGDVVSIDISPASFNEIGSKNLRRAGIQRRHSLIEEPSERVLPKFFLEGRSFDFVFIDGWKTFDHLALEIYGSSTFQVDLRISGSGAAIR